MESSLIITLLDYQPLKHDSSTLTANTVAKGIFQDFSIQFIQASAFHSFHNRISTSRA